MSRGERGSVRHTFVLVHGAYHGGWCWCRVAEPLRSAGHRVFAPTLTGSGERAHLLDENVSVETGIDDVVGVIEFEELGDAVLVGHSFGAVAVLGTADRIPHRIRSLILLDGLIAEHGTSAFAGMTTEQVDQRLHAARETSGGLTIPAAHPSAFGVTAAEDVEWLQRRLTPQPVRPCLDTLHLEHPSGNGLATTYIACTNPPFTLVAASHDMARQRTDWTWCEIATGHDAMITTPNYVVDLLIRLAGDGAS